MAITGIGSQQIREMFLDKVLTDKQTFVFFFHPPPPPPPSWAKKMEEEQRLQRPLRFYPNCFPILVTKGLALRL